MYAQKQEQAKRQMQERLVRTWENMSKIRYRIAVMGGKGGVGKTTVALNLAWVLSKKFSVGVLDADIDCPNVNKFLGITERVSMRGEKTILPTEKHGLKVFSMASLQESEDTAIMWRGPLIANTLAQFLENTEWGKLDFLFFDAPPGTSDVALSLMQSVDLTGIVVVSTPQGVSVVDAKKTLGMARQLNVRVLGLVENMSGDIFGKGSVQKLSEDSFVPFLGRILFDKKIVSFSEKGLLPAKEDKKVQEEFEKISRRVLEIL